MSRCAVLEFSPRTPFVTPVLLGPGSDIRMKMGWKVLDKTRKSGVWFFRDAEDWLGSGGGSLGVLREMFQPPRT